MPIFELILAAVLLLEPPSLPRPAWEHAVVEAIDPVATVYARPEESSPSRRVRPARLDPGPQVFLVAEQRDGWVRVLLPIRPNGSSGWMQEERVRHQRTSTEVAVDLDTRRLTVRDRGRLIVSTRVAVGAPATPTPRGRWYVTYAVRLSEPDGVYGPYAIGISAHSPTLATFNGQDAQIALHGTDRPELLGQAVSNGCVRLPNSVVRQLVDRLSRGTPVTIT